MDLLIKHLTTGACLLLCLGLLLFSQPVRAQFKHKWQADVAVGIAVPAQDAYYIKEGYPHFSIAGNVRPGQRVQAQLMRNLNNWVAAGAGAEFASFGSMNLSNQKEHESISLASKALTLNGKIYPLGRQHRITPYLQATASYGQVSIAHNKFSYTVDSLSKHSGNPDHPVLLQVDFTRPEASQTSQVVGFGGAAGAEMLLSDVAGLTWHVGYHLHKSDQMQLLQEDLVYWDIKVGLFVRMYKTKRFY